MHDNVHKWYQWKSQGCNLDSWKPCNIRKRGWPLHGTIWWQGKCPGFLLLKLNMFDSVLWITWNHLMYSSFCIVHYGLLSLRSIYGLLYNCEIYIWCDCRWQWTTYIYLSFHLLTFLTAWLKNIFSTRGPLWDTFKGYGNFLWLLVLLVLFPLVASCFKIKFF